MGVDSHFVLLVTFVGVLAVADLALGAAVKMLVVFLILWRYLALHRSTECVVREHQGGGPREPRRDVSVSGIAVFACSQNASPFRNSVYCQVGEAIRSD